MKSVLVWQEYGNLRVYALDEIVDYRNVISRAARILINDGDPVGTRLAAALQTVETMEHHRELLDNVIEYVEDFIGEQFETFIELKVRRGSND